MRYTEAKDRSAEFLRLALGHMGRHEAAFNPITFTLWYEYVAGLNPRLALALDALVAAKTAIDDPTALRLFQEHVVPADEAAMRRISSELQRVMSDIAQSAWRTGDRAGLFGAQLSGLSAALQANDMARLTPQLSEALAGTAQMKHSAEALQHQVAASHDEISQLRTDLDRARSEALLDPLTGILNRKGFDERLQALLGQPAALGQSHCLVMLDIDHFKKVNDTHGHVMGDRVIQAVGAVLRSSISNDKHAAARYGGEEFALLLGGSSIDDGAKLAEAVRLRTKAMKIRHRNTQDVLFSVTISGGVASLQQGDDASSLIARADAALYASKRAGRDRVSRG
ncbi:MAG: GGDEF domain-containing protein [Bacteriovorax sp.]|nr:GGDEF domain-containing protein [Rhizobacter sp.]